MKLTLFPDVYATSAREIDLEWSKFVRTLRDRPPRERKEGELVKLCTFGKRRTDKNSLRHDANVIAVHGIEGDHDSGEISPAEAVRRLERHHLRAVVVTSWSQRPAAPRWRVFAPLSRPHYIVGLNGALGGVLTPESFACSQAFFIDYPAGGERLVLPTFGDSEEGIFIDDWDGLDEFATSPAARAPGQFDPIPEKITEGLRHPTLVRLAKVLRRLGLEQPVIADVLELVNGRRCDPPKPADEVRKIAEWAAGLEIIHALDNVIDAPAMQQAPYRMDNQFAVRRGARSLARRPSRRRWP